MPNIYLPPVSPASVHLATRSHLDFCLMAPSPDFFASQMFLDMEIRTVHLLIELDFWIVLRVHPIQIRFGVLRFHLRAMAIIC